MALGSVATATFTRAEIDTMLKRAMYSNGRVIYSGNIGLSGTLTLPSTVDYISIPISDGKEELKIARGCTTKYTRTLPLSSGSMTTSGLPTYEYTFQFSADGTFKTSYRRISGSSVSQSGNYNLTGYHYY